MGIISDTFEDNREHFWQQRQEILPIKFDSKEKIEKPAITYCPLCNELLFDELSFKKHMFSIHANKHAYIRANGVILQDVAHIKGFLDELQVQIIGEEPVNVSISINGFLVKEFLITNDTSLLTYLKDQSPGIVEISLAVNCKKDHFILYFGDVLEFENSKVDTDAFNLLFYKLDRGHDPEFEKFQCLHMLPHVNVFEKRYASGLFSYALAFSLTRNGKSGKTHFEDSLHDLCPFATPFAVSAQRVLALRMNFFEMLIACNYSSKFAVANYFFNNKKYRFNLPAAHIVGNTIMDYGIFIDDYSTLYLEALNAYYNDDWNIFEIYKNKLTDIQQLNVSGGSDRNNDDKLFLLKARAAIKKKDTHDAKNWYYQLIAHPSFSNEAKAICDEL